MVKAVRGIGLLIGIEFDAPARLSLRVPFEAFSKIHPAMFGQILVMRLFRDHGILTQICGNDFMVLKVAPPLMISEAQVRSIRFRDSRSCRTRPFFLKFLVRSARIGAESGKPLARDQRAMNVLVPSPTIRSLLT